MHRYLLPATIALASISCTLDRSPRLTIRFTPRAGCEGGDFMVDGVMQGRFPVREHSVPAGRHTIGIRSANDCAGYGDLELELGPGEEEIIDLDSESDRRRRWR
ncbi:MAG: hypothetical protein IT378_18835 [Sandaracinaceae bacterium]|nr:hypothetical protein [Sandaracinaceae bacterium]